MKNVNGVTYTGVPIPHYLWVRIERMASKQGKDVSELSGELIAEGFAARTKR